jgi:hypothetical protein
MTGWARWWPLTGVAFVGLWVAAFALIGDDAGNTDSEILAYYTKDSNRTKHAVAFFLILAAGLFFLWFLSKLRERLAQVEGGAHTQTALAYGAGIAAATLWLVGSAFFTAASFALDEDEFTLDPNTYRILDNIGYTAWFSGTTVAAITVTVTAVLALRTGLLPKWIAWLSFPVALTMLVAFFFIPFLIMLGWILVVSATFMMRWEAPPAPAA